MFCITGSKLFKLSTVSSFLKSQKELANDAGPLTTLHNGSLSSGQGRRVHPQGCSCRAKCPFLDRHQGSSIHGKQSEGSQGLDARFSIRVRRQQLRIRQWWLKTQTLEPGCTVYMLANKRLINNLSVFPLSKMVVNPSLSFYRD